MANSGGVLSGAAQGASAGSAFGPWGTVIGGVIGAAGGLFGGKKAAPMAPYTPVDLQAEQKKALQGNLAAEPDLEKLLSESNAFQQGQATSLMEKALPGWGKLQGKLMATTDELLTNPYDVPADVQANLARIASERGISTGGRGQFNDFSLLRDLGVNALQYGQSRIGTASGLTQLLASVSPRVNPMSPMSFYVTPQEQAGEQRYTNTVEQQIRQGSFNAETAASNFKSQAYADAVAELGGLISGNSRTGGGGGIFGGLISDKN